MSNQDRVLQQETCESVAYIPMQVSTPVNLRPYVRKLPLSACICGEPELTPTPCGTYILTQYLCVKVPIEIGVKSKIGNPIVNGGNATTNDNSKKHAYNHWNTPNIII